MPVTTADTLFKQRGKFNLFGQSPEQAAEMKALEEKLNQEARENWDSPEWHRQVAADLQSSLDYGFTFNNVFQTWFRTDTVGEADRVVLRERRGMKVYWTARGGWIDETQLSTEEWTLPRDTIGFHVSEMEDKIRLNFATTMSDLVNLAEARLEAEVNRRILSTLTTAIPDATSDSYVSVAGLDADDLNTAIREVKDAIKPNGQGPAPVTILGRASMIDKILDVVSGTFSGFTPQTNEEILRQGRLGSYRGANIVNIINYTDEEGSSYFPANELWVFGGDVGRFVFYGPMLVKTWTENNVDYVHYRARKDCGGLVNHAEQARRIIDTTVSA
jgi:hypothetical protein